MKPQRQKNKPDHDRKPGGPSRQELMRRYMDSTAWATDPLTRRTALQEANSAADLRYKPVQRELRDELRGSARQQGNIDLSFDLYTKKLADLQARSQQAYQAGTQQVFNQANTMAGDEGQKRALMDAQAQASAAQRGATAGPSDQSAQASRARQMLQTSFGGLIANRGLGETSRLLEQERIGERQRIQEKGKEYGYAKTLREKRRELKADRGDFLNDYLARAREGERRYGLERKVFGLNKREAENKVEIEKAKIREARRKERQRIKEADRQYQLDLAEYGAGRADELWDRRHKDRVEDRQQQEANEPDKGNPKWTPTQREGFRNDYNKGISLARQSLDHDDYDGDRAKFARDFNKNLEILTDKLNGNRMLARAALQTVMRGGARPALARKIRKRYGIKVPKGNYGGANSIQGIGG